MPRLFCEHKKREVQSLDGAWRFCVDREDVGEREGFYARLADWKTSMVPSTWNTEQGLLTYVGVAWYARDFYSRGGTLRFCFGGVMTEAKVWLDGEYLGEHYGGFCQFELIAKDVKEGKHTLTLRVDNRFNARSIPQEHVDWYYYGGITRSVSVERLDGVCILSQHLEYELSFTLDKAVCTLKLELYNATDRARATAFVATLDGKEVATAELWVGEGKSEMLALPPFEIEAPRLWDVGAPELYELCSSTESDDLIDRIGFRRIEVKDGAVLLNGKRVEFRGVNRHEEHPEFGFAFPPALMKRDIDLAVGMGCNALRGSHYPNSREFVDMLDERGILFWSEIPIWGCGFSDEALADKTVVERGLSMHREMVKYYYNHPCIVIWGMHNEINSYTEPALRMTRTYYDFLKKNGGGRLVTYATCHPEKDICLDLCDVICINQYYGWYYGYEEDSWEKFLERFCEYAESKGVADKPIIMSEFGCAAMFGWHDCEDILWSEENQAKQIGNCLKLFHEHERVTGSFIWQFCDMRTCLKAGINRARGFNNKGLLNEHRKPKLAYAEAKRLYLSFIEEEKK